MSAAVNGNFAELYRVRFGPTPPQATDPHILWADTTASPATLKTYSGGQWVPVAGGSGQGGGVASVAVAPPATNTGTPTDPIIGVAPATAQAAGSLAAADYGKLAGVQAGAQANVLEAVSGTAPITVGAVANKAQAIGIAPASQAAPGSLSAADKTKLDGMAAGAQANALEDVTLGSSTTAVIVSNGGAGGIVGKVKSIAFTIANAVANGAAGLLSGADKAKIDGVAAGAEVNVLTVVTGTAPITAGAVANKVQAIGIAPATTGAAGSMSAGDKALVGHLSEPGGTGVQLAAPAGLGFLAAKDAAYLAANASYDGAAWQRYDTGQAARMLALTGTRLDTYQAPAGANPISWAGPLPVGGAPQLRLVYAAAADLLSGAALPANTYVDLTPAQSFTVAGVGSIVIFQVRAGVLVTAPGGFNCALAALVDGATLERLDAGWGAGASFESLGGATFLATGLAAGAHTVKLQVRADVAATAYCRASSAPTYEFAAITALELT